MNPEHSAEARGHRHTDPLKLPCTRCGHDMEAHGEEGRCP